MAGEFLGSRSRTRLSEAKFDPVAELANAKVSPGTLKMKIQLSEPKTAVDLGYVLQGEVIKLEVQLVDHQNSPVTSQVSGTISCTLVQTDKDQTELIEAPSNILKLEASSDKRFSGRKACIRFSIREISANMHSTRFALKIHLKNLEGTTASAVQPCISPLFSTVRQKLVSNTWTQASGGAGTKRDSEVCTFFKDEGGHSNCVEAIIELVDANNRRVLNGRSIPLRVELRYEKKNEALPMNLLTLSPESRLAVDEQGWTKIKYRINEVSTRHQGQNFVLVVTPDVTALPASRDIGYIMCAPVEVRSKRNKPRAGAKDDKKRKAASTASAVAAGHGSGAAYKRNSNGLSSLYSDKVNVMGKGHSAQSTAHYNYGYPMSSGSTGGNQAAGAEGLYDLGARGDEGTGLMVDAPNMPHSMAEAVQQINHWTSFVLTVAQQIAWQQIGMNPGTGQPLYSMPNPNDKLLAIMEQYNDYTRGSLTYLLNHESVIGPHYQQLQSSQSSGVTGGANGYDSGSLVTGSGKGTTGNTGMGVNGGPSSMESMRSGDGMYAGLSATDIEGLQFGAVGGGSSGPGSGAGASPTGLQGAFQSHGSFSFMDHLDDSAFHAGEHAPKLASNLVVEEGPVDLVLAKSTSTDGGITRGLPAFDENRTLIGFYNQREDVNVNANGGAAQTVIYFVPLNDVDISPSVAAKVQEALQVAVAAGDNAVYSRSSAAGDVIRLREQAMESYFMSQATVEL